MGDNSRGCIKMGNEVEEEGQRNIEVAVDDRPHNDSGGDGATCSTLRR